MHIDSPGFVSHQQLDRKIAFRKIHQKNITEGEKFMKVMNKPGNLCNLSLVSCVLCIRIQPLIIASCVFFHKLLPLCKGTEGMSLNEPFSFSSLFDAWFLIFSDDT